MLEYNSVSVFYLYILCTILLILCNWDFLKGEMSIERAGSLINWTYDYHTLTNKYFKLIVLNLSFLYNNIL